MQEARSGLFPVVDSRSEQRPVALPVSGRVSEANEPRHRITPPYLALLCFVVTTEY